MDHSQPASRRFLNSFLKPKDSKHRLGRAFFFFGVILPLLALIFETNTHFCAKRFFDPFPSASHVVLFCLIPLSNYMAWLSFRKDLSSHLAFMSLLTGMAMGIGCLYSLMFLPLSGLSCLCILAFGFGLLGLSPLLSLPCAWIAGKRVCGLASKSTAYVSAHQLEHIGHLIILVMVVAIELPSTLTRMHLSEAVKPETSIAAIKWLRAFGDDEVLLRACYERSGRATDILGSLYESGHPVGVDDARKVYYRVTGRPFNSVPIPSSARATIQHAGAIDDPDGLNAGVEDEFDLDTDIAGETVSGVARGLTVKSSTITGEADPRTLSATLNWEFVFNNASAVDREARAKILLPPGAVVNKATITINGVERDATIMVRDAARAVYKRAVKEHKKDPLLVSTCGVDQILVQCYPVPANSSVKLNLSMVTPLAEDSDNNASMMLPAFEERNFQFDVPTHLAIESSGEATVSGASEVPERKGPNWANAKVEPNQMANFSATFHAQRSSHAQTVFWTDPCPLAPAPSPTSAPPPATPQAAGAPATPVYQTTGTPATPVYQTTGTPAKRYEVPSLGPLASSRLLPAPQPVGAPAQPHGVPSLGPLASSRRLRVPQPGGATTAIVSPKFTYSIVQQNLDPPSFTKPTDLTIVIDGSTLMRNSLHDIVAGLRTLPPGIGVNLFVVGDETKQLGSVPGCESGRPSFTQALDELDKYVPVGGQDNFTSLLSALTSAESTADAAVLWIHASQPITAGKPGTIKDLLKKHQNSPLLYDVAITAGPDEILNSVQACSSYVRVPRSASIIHDLKGLYQCWLPPPVESKRSLLSYASYTSSAPPSEEHTVQGKTAKTLATLYAYQQILSQFDSLNPDTARQALSLAAEYHLVTPVSSAVVVDNDTLVRKPAPPKPTSPMLGFRRALKGKMDATVSELSALNQYSETHLLMKSKEQNSAPVKTSADAQLQSLGEVDGPRSSRSSNDEFVSAPAMAEKKAAAMNEPSPAEPPAVQIGSKMEAIIADSGRQSGGFGGPASAPASAPVSAQLADKDASPAKEGAVFVDESAEETEKVVPEADFWLLLAVASGFILLAIRIRRGQGVRA